MLELLAYLALGALVGAFTHKWHWAHSALLALAAGVFVSMLPGSPF